jgi:transcriptional regulator of acetoin/glycerol metabolism
MASTPPAHARLIQASWARCRAAGLHHESTPRFDELDAAPQQQWLERHQALINSTHHQVLPYYQNLLGNSHCLIRLADRQGRLLKAWGSQRFVEGHLQRGFQPGACWLESLVGTNAIGTALACEQAVHIEHDEHFLQANRFMTGSAAPIFDAQRQLVAVLDVSSDTYLPPSHTLGLVKMMSQTVENRLMLDGFEPRYFELCFNTGLNNLSSQWAGLLLFDESGRVLAANRRADSLLGQALPGQHVQTLFMASLASLLDHPAEEPFTLLASGRQRLQCRLKRPLLRSVPVAPNATCDPRVSKALLQGSRLLEKNIPLLILGETGTGKEVLVKALHAASSRASQPLVAVNCAAIPSELVESELFGYERGAFTGANQKGNPGLIRKADQGVLFLDEIGDMPLATQARLLRVVQERCIQPLGSGEPLPVDLRIVCATHADLRAQVKAGKFREDLYYRLAGMTVTLPPLREREDKRELILQLWEQHREPGQTAGLSEALVQALVSHPWPGNLRQLSGVIQVALAMAENDRVELTHLPQDILDELVPPRPTLSLASVTDLGELLEASDGNITRLAKRLGVSRNTLYKRLKAQGHGLQEE